MCACTHAYIPPYHTTKIKQSAQENRRASRLSSVLTLSYLQVEAWVPEAALGGYIQSLLSKAAEEAQSKDQNGVLVSAVCKEIHFEIDMSLHGGGEYPPTLIRTNDSQMASKQLWMVTASPGARTLLLHVTDLIYDNRYAEINPGFFAIAIFPFLFGIMFGDMIHGSLMAVGGLLLVSMEGRVKANYKQQNEMFLSPPRSAWR